MSAILLRKLTRKSTLKFGKFKDYTVDHLFSMKKERELTAIYFKLSNISFMDDVLDDLGITIEYRIEKPSKNLELYSKFMEFRFGKRQKPNKKLQGMRKETQSFRKDFLTRLNHGH